MFVDFDKIDDVPDDRLMTCLSMICPFDKAEQQALLEARNQKERCSILMTMLDFALKDLENKQKQ
jgi:Lon protease-like protein